MSSALILCFLEPDGTSLTDKNIQIAWQYNLEKIVDSMELKMKLLKELKLAWLKELKLMWLKVLNMK